MDDRPVPASPVNIIGRIRGDAARLRDARGAGVVRVEKV
ncbi:cyclophilin-like family protein [Methanoculleus taiwanensis]|nr:cyclophilin-like family protein [Methanoculleus taiwanensis]